MPNKESWEGVSRAPALGYRIFIWLLRIAGLKAAYKLLHVVTLYYRLFVPAATKPLRYLYRQRLGFNASEAKKLVKKNLYIFGQTLIDKVVVLAGNKNAFTFEEEGIDNISNMHANGKGGILVSAHLGNWEVAGHLLEHIG
ncbi:MAG: LpxL/LpxP family acyltransferase, partial [Flavipsychrobacter sp.]